MSLAQAALAYVLISWAFEALAIWRDYDGFLTDRDEAAAPFAADDSPVWFDVAFVVALAPFSLPADLLCRLTEARP